MSHKRDARVDPKPGDVVEFGPQWQREGYAVIWVKGNEVQYQIGPMRAILRCALDEWREWNRSAGEVIRAAE